MAGKAHHADPAYRRLAAQVRAQAYANPDTRCARCGLTLGTDTWDAGHVVDGDLSAGLVAEHARCNRSAGAIAGNARRGSSFNW
jgi:hypothetical protein